MSCSRGVRVSEPIATTVGVPVLEAAWAAGRGSRGQPLARIAEIEWDRRKIIDGGGYALVYEVAPGVVAKVGNLEPDEVEAQEHFAAQGKALPVWDYKSMVDLPLEVSKEACPFHGARADILPFGPDDEDWACTCGELQAILLMPRAEEVGQETSPEDLASFMEDVSTACWVELNRCWDLRPANVARYQGHLVALDFGEES